MWIWKKRFLPTYFQKLREIKVMGNTFLKGATDCLLLPNTKERLVNIAEKAMKVGLAEDKDFQNIYVEEMYFPEID